MTIFTECQTPQQVKALYREWSKVIHPDAGGNGECFHDLNQQYQEALTRTKQALYREHLTAGNEILTQRGKPTLDGFDDLGLSYNDRMFALNLAPMVGFSRYERERLFEWFLVFKHRCNENRARRDRERLPFNEEWQQELEQRPLNADTPKFQRVKQVIKVHPKATKKKPETKQEKLVTSGQLILEF